MQNTTNAAPTWRGPPTGTTLDPDFLPKEVPFATFPPTQCPAPQSNINTIFLTPEGTFLGRDI